MTDFNRQVSAVTRRVVELGETVLVTNRGKVVLRLVPEPDAVHDPLAILVAAGLATPPRRKFARYEGRSPVKLSGDLDDILREVNADVDL